MIVLDASAALELLLGTDPGIRLGARLLGENERLCAPHLLDVEVAHVLRRYERSGDLTSARAKAALVDLAELPIVRYAHAPLLLRMWQLRSNLTAYDAAYVALAEALECPLWTFDSKLAAAPGHRAQIEVI